MKLNNYFPFHKLIDDFWGSLPLYWLSPNPKTTFQSNTLMLLKLCTHKVWHFTYGDMHSIFVGFHNLAYATFFICFDNEEEFQVCCGWTTHSYPFDTYLEIIDIFLNCCAQDVKIYQSVFKFQLCVLGSIKDEWYFHTLLISCKPN
jgi:hypothetical protein